MTKSRIDLINIGLIVLAFFLALIMPFKLFLLAYAFLGPLHYLTEINWLEEKQFYLPTKTLFAPLAGVATLVVLPKILAFLGITNTLVEGINEFSNVLLLGAIGFSIAWLSTDHKIIRWIVLALFCSIGFLLKDESTFVFLVGAMLPTLIHVYLFTALFMLSGAIRSKSYMGLLSVLLLATIPIAVAYIPIDPNIYTFSTQTKQQFAENGFANLIIALQQRLGVSTERFLFYDPLIIRLQVFVAFAYLYHYLNWFSKTGIIGWGKALRGKRLYLVLGIWSVIAVLFLIDYRIGFMASLLLSFLHVLLELPLNIVSIRTIILAPLNHFKK